MSNSAPNSRGRRGAASNDKRDAGGGTAIWFGRFHSGSIAQHRNYSHAAKRRQSQGGGTMPPLSKKD